MAQMALGETIIQVFVGEILMEYCHYSLRVGTVIPTVLKGLSCL